MLGEQSIDDLNLNKFSHVFMGSIHDERGKHAEEKLKKSIGSIHVAEYVPEELQIKVNDNIINPFELTEIIEGDSSILIESTTLGTAEIILLSKVLFSAGYNKLSYLYIEPLKYQKNPSTNDVVHRRDFEITCERRNFSSVPSMNYILEHDNHVMSIFAGFEGERMLQALETHDIAADKTYVAFGVPAFNPGWEMDSFANHVNLLIEHNISSRHHYCAANNPLLAYKYLADTYINKQESERMFVIPLGTKPQSIGVAAFLSENDDVGLMYDHPYTSNKSSEGISTCHLFTVEKENG